MAWSDAARAAAAEARKRGAVRLGKWDAMKGKGIIFPAKGSFSRETLAGTVKEYRALARGTLSAKAKKSMGPVKKPTTRLTGRAGAEAWNAFAATGFRSWGKGR